MVSNHKIQDYEQVVEKIVFDEDELKKLKIAIREFSIGNIDAKHLKQLLIKCRGRIVNDFSQFLTFCIDRKKNDLISGEKNKVIDIQVNQNEIQLQQKLNERNELLELVARRVKDLLVKSN